MTRKTQTSGRGRGSATENGPMLDLTGAEISFGRHEADEDVLVFDPAESDAGAAIVSLYSLTQHRVRRVPRAIVQSRIHGIIETEELESAAQKYANRQSLKAEHSKDLENAADRSRVKQREAVLEQHLRYLASIGVESEGVRDTEANGKYRRRTKCHACGIALDNYVGAYCMVCVGVLCSCGACACRARES